MELLKNIIIGVLIFVVIRYTLGKYLRKLINKKKQ